MKRAFSVTLGTIVLWTLSACNGSGRPAPVAPSFSGTPPPPTASTSVPAGPGSGTVTIRDLAPDQAATLGVRSDCLNVDVTVLCTENWRGTFDVLVDRDMTYAVLTARFYDGNTLCAYAANTLDLVPAGRHVSLPMTRIYLSDHSGKRLDCKLPATTSRLEVELWSDSSAWTNTLVQEFERTYTFSEVPVGR